jgi:hypothetical protein
MVDFGMVAHRIALKVRKMAREPSGMAVIRKDPHRPFAQ